MERLLLFCYNAAMTPEDYDQIHDMVTSLSDDMLLDALAILEIEIERRGLAVVFDCKV